jgi:hypothetical protein
LREREYLVLRRTRKRDNGENYKMRRLMMCTPHPDIVQVIKSGRMKWAEHVVPME